MDTRTVNQTVGANVSKAIRRAGENPHSIAAKTGLSRSTLNRNLKGLGPGFPIPHLFTLAAVLDTTAAELVALPSSFYRPIESAAN